MIRTHFCALRACGAREAGFFFHGFISFPKTVPTRYRMPPDEFAKYVLFRRAQAGRQGDRQTDRQTGRIDITNIYI